MPSNLLMSDVSFPKFEKGQSSDEKINMILNYLHMLQEQLRYTLANVGVNNFNETEIKSLGEVINQPVFIRLEDATGKITNLDATVNGLIVNVKDNTNNIASLVITSENLSTEIKNEAEKRESRINQLANSIKLEVKNSDGEPVSITLSVDGEGKGTVNLSGLVTFSSLEDPGSGTVIDGGNIRTGVITGIVINGCYFKCTNAGGGKILMLDSDHTDSDGNPVEAGRIEFVSTGTADSELLIATDDTDVGANYNIRLSSAGTLHLDSADGIYINGVSLDKYISNKVGNVVAVFG